MGYRKRASDTDIGHARLLQYLRNKRQNYGLRKYRRIYILPVNGSVKNTLLWHLVKIYAQGTNEYAFGEVVSSERKSRCRTPMSFFWSRGH